MSTTILTPDHGDVIRLRVSSVAGNGALVDLYDDDDDEGPLVCLQLTYGEACELAEILLDVVGAERAGMKWPQ